MSEPLPQQADERFIPVDEVIRRAAALNIPLGRPGGNPYHTLRYYTKIGLLPHMSRKLPYPGAESTVGHYPESVVETLRKITELKEQGLDNEAIKQKLESQRIKEAEDQALAKLAPSLARGEPEGPPPTPPTPPPPIPPSFFTLPEALRNISQTFTDLAVFIRNMVRKPYPYQEPTQYRIFTHLLTLLLILGTLSILALGFSDLTRARVKRWLFDGFWNHFASQIVSVVNPKVGQEMKGEILAREILNPIVDVNDAFEYVESTRINAEKNADTRGETWLRPKLPLEVDMLISNTFQVVKSAVFNTARFLGTIFFGKGDKYYVTPAADASLHSLRVEEAVEADLIVTDYLLVSSQVPVANLNADFLDSLDSSRFLRSDTSDKYTSGTLTFLSGTTLNVNSRILNTAGNLTIADSLSQTGGGQVTFSGNVDANSGLDVAGITILGDGGISNFAQFSPTGDLAFYGSADTITSEGTLLINPTGNLLLTAAGNTIISTGTFALNNIGAATIGINGSEQDITFETANFDVNSTGAITIDGTNFTYTPTGTYTVDAAGAITIDSDASSTFSGAGVNITSDGANAVTITYAAAGGTFRLTDGTTRIGFADDGSAVFGDDGATTWIDGLVITLSGNTVIVGTITETIPDNTADAFDLQDENNDNYLNINTTDGSEEIQFGNASTNPIYSFLGSGNFAVSTTGDFVATLATNIDLATANLSAADIDIGTSAQANAITIGTSAAGATLELDSADWGITTTGVINGISGYTQDDGFFSHTGSTSTLDLTDTILWDTDSSMTLGAASYALTVDSGTLALTGDGTNDIDISNAGAAIDIDSATLDILTTGAFSIDGTGNSNVSATSGNLTLSTIASGNLILDSAGTIEAQDNLNANAGLDVTGAPLTVGGTNFQVTTAGAVSTVSTINSAYLPTSPTDKTIWAQPAATNPTGRWLFDGGTSTYTDTGVMMGETNDFKYYAYSTKFSGVYLAFSTPGIGYNISAEYSQGGEVWGSLTIIDETTNFTSNGSIYFTPPGDWATDTVNGVSGYWIRFSTSTNPSQTAITSANYILPTGYAFAAYLSPVDTTPKFYVDYQGNVQVATLLVAKDLEVQGKVRSNLIPSQNNQYDLGSSSLYWDNAYINTVIANNLSGTVITGATSSNTWTINSDAGDPPTDDMSLIFYRGGVEDNAVLGWDESNDYFTLNAPLVMSSGIGTATLTVPGNINSTGGAIRTNTITRIDNAGNLQNIGTYTSSVTPAGTTAVNLISGTLTNDTTGGTQRGLVLTLTGSGDTELGALIQYTGTGTGTTALEIAGTWTNGIITNDHSVDAGTGTISGGTGNFSTKITTPEIENTGNITIDVINTSADSTVYVLNSDGTYRANLDVEGDLTIGGTSIFSGDLTVTGHLLPSANDQYDLGSDTARWRDLYLGAETLHLGTSTANEATISYTTSLNDLEISNTYGDIVLQPISGSVGIGVAGPVAKLEVAGDIKLSGSGDDLYVYSTFDIINESSKAIFDAGWSDNFGGTGLNIGDYTAISSSYDWTGDEPSSITTSSNYPLLITEGSGGFAYQSVLMVVDDSGSVGIGTTSPLGDAGDLTLGSSAGTKGTLYLYGSTAGKYSRIETTDGNLHIDAGYGAGGSDGIYLNYYNGGTIYFGTGATGYHSSATTAGNWILGGNLTVGGTFVSVGTTTKTTNLNADLLDDQHGSYYLSAAYLSGRSLADANSADNTGVTAYYLTGGAANKPTGTDHALFTLSYNSSWSVQMAGDWRTNEWYVRNQNNASWGSWQNLWHSGNDGSGSGLDADLLDGIDSTGFIRDLTPGDWEISSSSVNSVYYLAALEVRESNLGGAGTGTLAQAPRISFHWSGRVASQIGMDSGGVIRTFNNPGTGYENFAAASISANGNLGVSGNLTVSGGQLLQVDNKAIVKTWLQVRTTDFPNAHGDYVGAGDFYAQGKGRFDGTLSVGVAPLHANMKVEVAGEVVATLGTYGQFRMVYGNYGAFIRNDGSDTYIPLLTNSGNQYGQWNTLRPMRVNNATGYVTFGNGHGDLAETFQISGKVLRSSLVSIDTNNPRIAVAATRLNSSLIGIISTAPGAVMDADGSFQIGYTTKAKYSGEKAPVALTGTVPALITSQNGPISPGDPIGTSETAGFGAKAVTTGGIVGKALEAFNPTTGSCPQVSSLSNIVWPDNDWSNSRKPCFRLPDGTYIGKIMVFVNVSWYDPDVYLTSAGDLQIVGSQEPLASSQEFKLKDKDRNLLTRIGAFAELAVAKIRTGLIEAKLVKADRIISPVVMTGSLLVTGDAKVEGVLEAGTIKANKIEGVEFQQVTNITEVTEITEVVEAPSSPQSKFINLISDAFEAVKAVIDELVVKNLTALTARITNLFARNLTVEEKIVSPVADLGEVTSDKVQTARLEIRTEGETTGEATIPTGEIKVLITNSLITNNSRIFVTPQVATTTPLAVTKLTPKDEQTGEMGGFAVSIAEPQEFDIPFHWWIVEAVPSKGGDGL